MLKAGGIELAALVGELGVDWLAVLGVTAYRAAFERPRAVVGRQDELLGGAGVWILPNPSGLNAHWPTPRLVKAFLELREIAT